MKIVIEITSDSDWSDEEKHSLTEGLGLVIKAARKTGLFDETIIVHSVDHIRYIRDYVLAPNPN